jgi:3-oxoacyl-[acyl-carrier protein] reductase
MGLIKTRPCKLAATTAVHAGRRTLRLGHAVSVCLPAGVVVLTGQQGPDERSHPWTWACAAAGRLEPGGVPVATAAADVTDTPALQRAVAEIATALGGLDHLVANAGGTVGPGNLTSAGDDDFTATFALNAGHAAELIRAGLPHLRAAGGGAVVIISSITGIRRPRAGRGGRAGL